MKSAKIALIVDLILYMLLAISIWNMPIYMVKAAVTILILRVVCEYARTAKNMM